MDTLRSKVIRLAHQNPDLRPHLLPLLKVSSITSEYLKFLEFPVGTIVDGKHGAHWEGNSVAAFVRVLQTVKALGFKEMTSFTGTSIDGSSVAYDLEEDGIITFTKRPDATYRYRIDLKL